MENYRNIRIVGRGSFGTVHLSERLSDKQKVVIKTISVEQMSDAELQESLNEVRVLELVRHPHVVRYVESHVQDRVQLHIVLEVLEGGSLAAFLRAQTRPPPRDTAVRWTAQLVLALHHVHGLHVLHRDLSSSNVLLSACHGFLKIGDFGISKVLASKSRALSLVGTPSYLSPELCLGLPYGKQSDLWALGVVLYEILTLELPFRAQTLGGLVMQILQGDVPPVPVEDEQLPLETVVTSLLQRNPESRPTTRQLLAHPLLMDHVEDRPKGPIKSIGDTPPRWLGERTFRFLQLEDTGPWSGRR